MYIIITISLSFYFFFWDHNINQDGQTKRVVLWLVVDGSLRIINVISGDIWLAQWVEHMTLDLWVVARASYWVLRLLNKIKKVNKNLKNSYLKTSICIHCSSYFSLFLLNCILLFVCVCVLLVVYNFFHINGSGIVRTSLGICQIFQELEICTSSRLFFKWISIISHFPKSSLFIKCSTKISEIKMWCQIGRLSLCFHKRVNLERVFYGLLE